MDVFLSQAGLSRSLTILPRLRERPQLFCSLKGAVGCVEALGIAKGRKLSMALGLRFRQSG